MDRSADRAIIDGVARVGVYPGSFNPPTIAHLAIADSTEAFAVDSANDPGTDEISRAHARYLSDVTRALLDRAVADGSIASVDTAAVARVLANVGADFAGPSVLPTLDTSPRAAADELVDVVLRGLRT